MQKITKTPLFEIPPEMRARLEALGSDIDRLKKQVVTLKELGFASKTIEDQIAYAEKVRETLLKEPE